MREFSVLIHRAPDLEGVWVAHCLNWDLVSQGGSPEDAARMIAESVVIAITEDEAEDLDPSNRSPAPKEIWELFRSTQLAGIRVALGDLDRVAKDDGAVIAAVMYVSQADASKSGSASVPSYTPEPFVIAELQPTQG